MKYRITIVSDACEPQVNGVVTSYNNTMKELLIRGYRVQFLTPKAFWFSISMPGYPEIRLSLFAKRAVFREIKRFGPEHIHIATEGPLGWAARRYCLDNKISFTTAFHTNFPQYVKMRFKIPEFISWAVIRRFHKPAKAIMACTETVRHELRQNKLFQIKIWPRGVDQDQFNRDDPDQSIFQIPGPRFVYVGRVSVEKNIEAFLKLNLPGTKIIIGDGPERKMLQQKYPSAVFLGYKYGTALGNAMAACDVFVFPRHTDTFGLVMIEALACGLPVAAYPVQGPIDIVEQGIRGYLDDNLAESAIKCLDLNRTDCISRANQFSWKIATDKFLNAIND